MNRPDPRLAPAVQAYLDAAALLIDAAARVEALHRLRPVGTPHPLGLAWPRTVIACPEGVKPRSDDALLFRPAMLVDDPLLADLVASHAEELSHEPAAA